MIEAMALSKNVLMQRTNRTTEATEHIWLLQPICNDTHAAAELVGVTALLSPTPYSIPYLQLIWNSIVSNMLAKTYA